MGDMITAHGTSRGRGTFSEQAAWIDAEATGNDSGQLVDRFQQSLVDRHRAIVVILAGIKDWHCIDPLTPYGPQARPEAPPFHVPDSTLHEGASLR